MKMVMSLTPCDKANIGVLSALPLPNKPEIKEKFQFVSVWFRMYMAVLKGVYIHCNKENYMHLAKIWIRRLKIYLDRVAPVL